MVISRAYDAKENIKKYPYNYYKDQDSRRYSEEREREVRNNHLCSSLSIRDNCWINFKIFFNKENLYFIMGVILNNRNHKKGWFRMPRFLCLKELKYIYIYNNLMFVMHKQLWF